MKKKNKVEEKNKKRPKIKATQNTLFTKKTKKETLLFFNFTTFVTDSVTPFLP